jgi:hypothetical protein
VQATALLPFVGAHLVTTDPFLALFETLAVWGFRRRLVGRAVAARRSS